jgi:3-dehydroquinate synthase
MHSKLNIPSKLNNYSLTFVSNIGKIQSYIDNQNTITIIDSNVNKLYPFLNRNNNIVLECNEDLKTLKGAYDLITILSNLKTNTNTKLVVIGGGILQDLVGFCASIYARGIEYILIPTTLLAQTDSCVGGKTSINFNNRKNLLGTFYPPSNIIICTEFLKTLSPLDYISGLGEIYKFYLLQSKISEFDLNSSIEPMILDGLKYKIDILTRDEFDKGERKFLNFGHTFGHALESTSNHKIPHGIAVILGSIIALKLSTKLGYQVPNYELSIEKGINLVKSSKITFQPEWFDLNSLLEIVRSDKKSTGKLTMVLLSDNPFLHDIQDPKVLTQILQTTYESI